MKAYRERMDCYAFDSLTRGYDEFLNEIKKMRLPKLYTVIWGSSNALEEL